MRSRLLFLLAIGIVLAIACDRSPAPQTPTPVQAATPLELRMNGGRPSVAVGDSFQLHASATFTDGSVSDVTSRAKWESSDGAVASVSPAGFVSFKQAGDVRISVTFQNQTDTWIVRVQNPA